MMKTVNTSIVLATVDHAKLLHWWLQLSNFSLLLYSCRYSKPLVDVLNNASTGKMQNCHFDHEPGTQVDHRGEPDKDILQVENEERILHKSWIALWILCQQLLVE